MIADDGDRPGAVGQSSERARDDANDAGVEAVELVLGAAVAGITPALREPVDTRRWVADTQRHTGIIDVAEPAAGNDERQCTLGERYEAVGARDHGSGFRAPLDCGARFDDRETGLDECDDPRVGASADDPPLRRIEQPR